MKSISSRLLSFVMALCLLVTLLPTGAAAFSGNVFVDGTEYYSEAFEVLELINEVRSQEGLSPLTMSEGLLDTAMLRSAEQAIFADHTRPDGSSCFTAFPSRYGSRGENIAAGQRTAAEVMEDWMNSPGHRANILKSAFSSVGVGCFQHNGIKYWTQCFSSEAAVNAAQPADEAVTTAVSIGSQEYDFYINGITDMDAGSTQTLKVTQSNPGFTYAKTVLNPAYLDWSSSDPTVASVSDGVVTAVSAGTAEIYAPVGINTVSILITVTGTAVHTHTMEYVAGKQPTYTEEGIMAHWVCTVCGRYYTDKNASAEMGVEDITLPKLVCTNHQWDEGVITTAPTATENGIKTYTCINCEKTKTETIPANAEITMMHSGDLNVTKPTRAQLTAKWSQITDTRDFFAAEPSVTAPYSTGELSSALLNSGLTYLNFIRYAAGLPSVQLDSELNDAAQHGAVVMAANNMLSHYPKQPANMDDDFYQKGYAATSSSNISMRSGYSSYNPVQSSVQGCMNDSSSISNLSLVGHRRWLLNPTLLNVGFGYAQSTAGSDYIATKVFDRSGDGVDYDFISWPASGNFPSNVFGGDVPWSVTLNPKKYEDPVLEELTVTLTRVSDNTVWVIDGSTDTTVSETAPYMTVNTDGYGVSNCIVFGIGGHDGTYAGTFTVNIKGLKTNDGTPTELNYQVEFFTLSTCTHKAVVIPAQPPTCEEPGLSEGSKCELCGMILTEQTAVPPTGHTETTEPAVEPTCEAEGRTEGKRCSECNKVIVTRKAIPALGHDYESEITTPATCTEEGVETFTCKNDSTHTYTEAIPKVDHKDNNDDGHCDECGTLTCTNHQPIQIPAVAATCTEDGMTAGFKCSICGEILTEGTVVPALGHDEAPDDEILPTCEEDGISEGSHCERCGEVINEQTVLPATGHTESILEAKDPTCEEEGLTEGTVCSVCDKVLTEQNTIPATGHEYENGVCKQCEAKDPDYVEPTPTVKPTPTPTPTPEVTPTPTPTIKPTPVVTPTPTPTVKPTPVVTPTPTPTVKPTPVVTPTPTPTVKPTPVVTPTPTPTPTVKPVDPVVFTDVSASDWFYTPVQWAVTNGITGGIGNNQFGPNNPCTRGQVVTFLWAAAGKPEPKMTYNFFTDVSESDYFYKAVMWAVQNGITAGTSDTTFSPDAPCTRGQVVTFLYAAADRPEPDIVINAFSDVTEADYYYKPVLWAVQNGITQGVGSGLFGPNNTCTRSHIVTFLYKADQIQ